MTSLEQFKNQQFICLETLRKTGVAVKTPVWFAEAGGKFFVWTQRNSGKAKRIRNNPRVRIVPSTARGEPQGDWIAATAGIFEGGTPDYKQGHVVIQRKYGLAKRMFEAVAAVRRDPYVVIEITPA